MKKLRADAVVRVGSGSARVVERWSVGGPAEEEEDWRRRIGGGARVTEEEEEADEASGAAGLR
jgi:hypothetical protein